MNGRVRMMKMTAGCICAAWLALSASAASGALRLNRMYSSHMVLQRGEPIRISGFADAGRTVTVRFRGETFKATAGEAGAWEVSIPPQAAGGPYEVEVADGESVQKIDDVMVGDVWFCTGQSNMFWPLCQSGEPERELAAADHPNIRLLDIALTGALEEVDEVPYVRGWSRCTPVTARNFSACAYHFARTVRERIGDVPIGLVGAGWGGPPIVHFLPPAKPNAQAAKMASDALSDAVRGFAEEDRMRTFCRSLFGDEARLRDWATAVPTGAVERVSLPCAKGLEQTVLKGFSGIALFRRTVDIPEKWAGRDLVLDLGETTLPSVAFLNGAFVGRVKTWDAPIPGSVSRAANRYAVRAADVKRGTNEIAVFLGCNDRLTWWSGLYGKLSLSPEGASGESISLMGDAWTCERLAVPKCGRTYGGSWCARIHPFFRMPVKGVLFYQGESDSRRKAADYLADHKRLIGLLREGWKNQDLPFYFMQLANHARNRNGENGFCEVREAQRLTVEEMPNTGMACSIDIGDDRDIHPKNKREQGRRMALQALRKTYGCHDVVADGPSFRELVRAGKTATVLYREPLAKLSVKGDRLTGFEARAKDGDWTPVAAALRGDKVELTAPFEIADVRYLWQNYPEPAAVLFDETGLPAVPFRTSRE